MATRMRSWTSCTSGLALAVMMASCEAGSRVWHIPGLGRSSHGSHSRIFGGTPPRVRLVSQNMTTRSDRNGGSVWLTVFGA